MELSNSLPVGVFDSGIGGISVLAELITCLPFERYVYYGDSKNAPYGERPTKEVKELSLHVVRILLDQGIKGLVVACNTATSGAIEDLRSALKIPIVGMEPALKPAVELDKKGKILVMATPVTLREKKFNNLIESIHGNSEIIKLPCPGLAEIIEKTGGKGQEVLDYLEKLLSSFDIKEVVAIVLGCTHYIFIREEILRYVDDTVELVDGNRGTAEQLKRLLQKHDLQNNNRDHKTTEVLLMNSDDSKETLDLCKNLLEEQLKYLGWNGNLKYV